jgi:hypothetical protein
MNAGRDTAWWNDFRSWLLVAIGVLTVLCERWFA